VYKNILQTSTMIYTTEGPRAFFKGLSPTLIQIAPHAGAQFSCYNIFTTIWKSIGKLSVLTVLSDFCNGGENSLIIHSLQKVFVGQPCSISFSKLLNGF